MEMRTNNEIPDPAAKVPDLPEALRYFILKACARDPSQRYQNIPEALESLKALINEYGLTNGEVFKKNGKVRMFYLVFNDDLNSGIKEAMDEFNLKMRSLGVELKDGELIDL
jgi:eukaryotic-like serine/threonine-protein kinase